MFKTIFGMDILVSHQFVIFTKAICCDILKGYISKELVLIFFKYMKSMLNFSQIAQFDNEFSNSLTTSLTKNSQIFVLPKLADDRKHERGH